jgi:hypothetical protein
LTKFPPGKRGKLRRNHFYKLDRPSHQRLNVLPGGFLFPPTPPIKAHAMPDLDPKTAEQYALLEAQIKESHARARGFCLWRYRPVRLFQTPAFEIGCKEGAITTAQFASFGSYCPCCRRQIKFLGLPRANPEDVLGAPYEVRANLPTLQEYLETKNALENGKPVCEGPEPAGEDPGLPLSYPSQHQG